MAATLVAAGLPVVPTPLIVPTLLVVPSVAPDLAVAAEPVLGVAASALAGLSLAQEARTGPNPAIEIATRLDAPDLRARTAGTLQANPPQFNTFGHQPSRKGMFRAREALRKQLARPCGTCADHGCLDRTCDRTKGHCH